MIWSLSYNTYDNITVCSLGSLVICGVAGSAIFLGISQSGGWRYHTQVNILYLNGKSNQIVNCNFGVLNKYFVQDQDNFDILDTDSWSGLTWLTMSMMGTMVSAALLVWSCAGKHGLSGEESSTKYRVKI